MAVTERFATRVATRGRPTLWLARRLARWRAAWWSVVGGIADSVADNAFARKRRALHAAYRRRGWR